MDVRWMAAMLVAVALAGCAEGDDDAGLQETLEDTLPRASGLIPVAPDPETFIGTIIESHEVPQQTTPVGVPFKGSNWGFLHELPEMHAEQFNLELLDHNDLSDGLIGPNSGFIEVDVVGDLALVASIMGSRGATLVDISDPAHMTVLSHIYNLDDNWDARISEDGQYVFLGCQGSSAFDCTGVDQSGEQPQTTGGGPCTSVADDAGTGCQGGIAVYDISDPSNPHYVDWLPMGFTHNVYTYMRDAKHYFMSASGRIGEWDPATGSVELVTVAEFGSHDMHVQQHPLTGDWLMYAGTAGSEIEGDGMGIWNVTDPLDPVPLSRISSKDYNESIPATWHEQTPMPCLIDGKHYTIGAGESGAGVAQTVAVIDTTDPTQPRIVGQWQLPDADSLSSQGMYRFSVHNVDGNCDGQVAIGHYHAGVWVFDISTPERVAAPVTLGYYQPHERVVNPAYAPVTGAPIGGVVTGDVPNVWTAQWTADGSTLIVPDMTTGLYALSPQWDFED